MMSSRSVLRLLLILAVFFASTAGLGDWLGSNRSIDIGDLKTQALRDPAMFWVTDRDLTPDQLPHDAFRPLTAAHLNRGITASYHWVKVRLSNAEGEQARHWVLSHETSYLDELLVYHSDDGGPVTLTRLSDRVPFAERPLNYRTLAFVHSTEAGGYTDLLMRLHFDKADTLTLNFHLSDARLFHDNARLEHLMYGAYYGLMLTLLVIAVIFAIILRHMLYLYYAAFLGFSILTWSLLNGFAFQYLWPGSVFWHNEGFHIVYLLMTMTALQFSRGFLKTARHFPRIHRLIRASQWLMATAILLRFAGVYEPVLYLSFLGLASLSLLAPLGFMAYRKGMRYARWYSAAWVFYGVSLVISVLSAGSSLFNWGMTPLNYAQAGAALEAVLLLIALGDKLIGWDRDRRLALQAANQDPVTGLGNRRALEGAFENLQNRFVARGLPVFLILIDLDHFKAVNDQYGHDAGDEVLREMGKLLQRVSRPQDICIRFGGEEFALLLHAPALQDAIDVAERIRTEFAQTPTRYRDITIQHTLTAGITQWVSSSSFTRSEMIRQADRALYEGKRAGRNRVQVYQDGQAYSEGSGGGL